MGPAAFSGEAVDRTHSPDGAAVWLAVVDDYVRGLVLFLLAGDAGHLPRAVCVGHDVCPFPWLVVTICACRA
jgi:hypothetical protein